MMRLLDTALIELLGADAGGATMCWLRLSETLLVFAEHRLFVDEARLWMEAGADLMATSAP